MCLQSRRILIFDLWFVCCRRVFVILEKGCQANNSFVRAFVSHASTIFNAFFATWPRPQCPTETFELDLPSETKRPGELGFVKNLQTHIPGLKMRPKIGSVANYSANDADGGHNLDWALIEID